MKHAALLAAAALASACALAQNPSTEKTAMPEPAAAPAVTYIERPLAGAVPRLPAHGRDAQARRLRRGSPQWGMSP